MAPGCFQSQFRPNLTASAAALCVALGGGLAIGQVDPNSGIDFVRIGAVGNAPWPGNGTVGDMAIGRGSVGYEYSIGKFEITTSQFVEFMNAAFDRPANDRIPFLSVPTTWGAAGTTPNTPGGARWAVPAGNEMRFVGNVSWRMAAIYCNWLCNNRSTDRSAFLSGAYDVSTFGLGPNGFTDQETRTPGARYFVPSWDEWLKAAHFDPNRNGPGQGEWWTYPHMSDSPLIYGRPGVGQANAGFGFDPTILLGAYPNVQSPWGLLDVAGGTREWTEGILGAAGLHEWRINDGSAWVDSGGGARGIDAVLFPGGDTPNTSTFDYGFRIASSIPAPGSCAIGVAVLAWSARRRRKT